MTTKWGRPLGSLALFSISILTIGGCQPETLYSWGGYEPSIQAMYTDQGANFKPADEIHRLSAEIQKDGAEKKKVPPGEYAYLGYLSYTTGDTKSARRYFEAEKQAFPQSAALMDRLTARLP